MKEYLTTIGLEVHVQLKTHSKMFCACGTQYGAPPNTHVCPVCLGYPGVLPTMNEEAIRMTVMTGLMLGSKIAQSSRFDRKSYFYPDMPKNYQISQYDLPLCKGGSVEIDAGDGKKKIRIHRIHLEEDVAKSVHYQHYSGVDFNRAGIPLMEIVSEADLASPEEAFSYLQELKHILLYTGVSDCNLEEGNMRCDVNCSVRLSGDDRLGVKTEIKNLNTFKGVLNALRYEADRQIDELTGGGSIQQETRRWDSDRGVTEVMRTKEYAHDYRYFPEPDLMPVALSREEIQDLKGRLPELPARRRERLISEYGLPEYDAGVLVADKEVADFFEAAAEGADDPKAVSNWVMTELLRLLSERKKRIGDLPLQPRAVTELVALVSEGKVNNPKAKEIFSLLFEHGGLPGKIAQEQGWLQVRDAGEIEKFVETAIRENPKCVEDFVQGKKAAAKFLVGQVMRLSKGKADPVLVAKTLENRLAQ